MGLPTAGETPRGQEGPTKAGTPSGLAGGSQRAPASLWRASPGSEAEWDLHRVSMLSPGIPVTWGHVLTHLAGHISYR